MRAALVRLHRWLGLALAVLLILSGLSGSVIAFQRELDATLNPELFTRVHAGPALGFDELAERVEAALPGTQVESIMPPAGFVRSALVRVQAAPGQDAPAFDEVFVDPATGAILGKRLWGEWRFGRENIVPFLFKFHYTLHLPGQWGAWVMGGVALTWAFDCLVALTITAPRGANRIDGWRRAVVIKPGAGSLRRVFDLHRAPGLWFWPLLLLMAISGVALNLREQVFTPVVSWFSEVSPTIVDRPVPASQRPAVITFEGAARAAEQHAPESGMRAAYVLHAPALNAFGVALAVPGQRDPRAGAGPFWLFIDDRDGSVRHADGPGVGTAGDTVTRYQYSIHTGLVAGLAGQILVAVIGLVTASLSVTGLLIWRAKRRGRRLERSSPSPRSHREGVLPRRNE